MKTVLLTGGSGFVGCQTIPKLLELGYDVHLTFRASQSLSSIYKTHKEIHYHQCDLLDLQQCQLLIDSIKPTHLLHLAWYTVPGKFWTSLENNRWVQSSLTLLNHFVEQGGNRVVFAGTCAEYNWDYGYCSEKVTPTSPNTLYGVCKNSLRQIFEQYCTQTGVSSSWGRIFFLYGPHENPARLVPSVINSLLREQTACCSEGCQVRDFMYVEDVASAFVKLLDSDVKGAVNIASGYPVTIRQLVELIGEKMDHKDLLNFGAIPSRPIDPPLLVADIERLTKEVGFSPKYTLDEGIRLTVDWWKQARTDRIL